MNRSIEAITADLNAAKARTDRAYQQWKANGSREYDLPRLNSIGIAVDILEAELREAQKGQ